MRLEVLNGFSRYSPDLESQPVPLVKLEGKIKPRKIAKAILRPGGSIKELSLIHI